VSALLDRIVLDAQPSSIKLEETSVERVGELQPLDTTRFTRVSRRIANTTIIRCVLLKTCKPNAHSLIQPSGRFPRLIGTPRYFATQLERLLASHFVCLDKSGNTQSFVMDQTPQGDRRQGQGLTLPSIATMTQGLSRSDAPLPHGQLSAVDSRESGNWSALPQNKRKFPNQEWNEYSDPTCVDAPPRLTWSTQTSPRL